MVPAGVQKGSAMRGILQDLLSDPYQSSLPDKGGIPLPQDVVRLLTEFAACSTYIKFSIGDDLLQAHS